MSQGNMSMVYKLQGKASQSKMPKSVKSAEYLFLILKEIMKDIISNAHNITK